MSSDSNLNQYLECIDSLPSMPIIAQKILALPLNTDQGEAELLKLIAQDPQTSAKIIGLSNTALFGAPGSINSVRDATMRLGMTQVKAVAVSMATLSALTRLPEGKLKSADLWAHSLAIANAMRIITKHMPPRMRPMEDKIFLAGLLHDIGYNVLNYIDINISNMLYEKLNADTNMSLLDIENKVLGTHHGEIGARLGLHWGLPEEIIAVIRYHHMPESDQTQAGQPLVSLVNIAEKLLPDFGIAELTAHEVTEQEWTNLHIETDKVDTIVEEIGQVAEKTRQLADAA